MKKIITCLLICAMAISFASCSANTAQDIRGEQTVNETLTADEEAAGETETTDTEKEFSLGDVEGLTYENQFIGIGCTLGSDWTFYSDEQIRELNNITSDIAGDEYREAVKDVDIIYDMYAVSSNQMDNVNVNLQKVAPMMLAAMDIAENYESAFSIIEESFKNMGYTDISHEIGTVSIDGKEFTSMNTTASAGEFVMYQTTLSIKCNGYLANVTVTTYNDNATDTILDQFYLIQ